MIRHQPRSTLFPCTALFRSSGQDIDHDGRGPRLRLGAVVGEPIVDDPGGGLPQDREGILERQGEVLCDDLIGQVGQDRKSTRLNSSHTVTSYAVFCLKKKKY